MLSSRLLSLLFLISLRILDCAESKVEGGEIDSAALEAERCNSSSAVAATPLPLEYFGPQDQTYKFTDLLNEDSFSNIFKFASKSSGKLAMTSKKIHELVDKTKLLRNHSGAGWDMPELTNDWNVGITSTRDSEELAAEMKLITELRNVTDEQSFIDAMHSNLILSKRFKKLSKPVLKYLVRMLYNGRAGAMMSSKFSNMRRDIYIYAARSGWYDILFEMKTHPIFPTNNMVPSRTIDSSIIFGYYNWVLDNPRARDFAVERMASINNGGRIEIGQSDINAWCSVCIHRKAPESYYFDHLRASSPLFYTMVYTYLLQFSQITLDPVEMATSHAFVKSLMDKFVSQSPQVIRSPFFIELLNDFRFGPHDAGIHQNLASIDKSSIIELITVASKANKKDLVRELSNNSKFDVGFLGQQVEIKNPQSFKAYFDIIETNPTKILKDNVLKRTGVNSLSYLTDNNFKIISVTRLQNNGIRLVIKSPKEYIELGFSPDYTFVLENENIQRKFLSDLQSKMFNDAARSGEEEFKYFLTRLDSNFFIDSRIIVSYKVVQLLLLEKAELIQLLRSLNIKLLCEDVRLTPELIASCDDVVYQ